jgi:hypothetical protein
MVTVWPRAVSVAALAWCNVVLNNSRTSESLRELGTCYNLAAWCFFNERIGLLTLGSLGLPKSLKNTTAILQWLRS